MNTNGSDTSPSGSPGSPDHDRSGATVDEAVANAEAGSDVEEVHTSSDETGSGESRVERVRAVDGVTEEAADGGPGADVPRPKPGPPRSVSGSGGAQRTDGARTSDRVAGGERAPDGPPFDTDADDNPSGS